MSTSNKPWLLRQLYKIGRPSKKIAHSGQVLIIEKTGNYKELNIQTPTTAKVLIEEEIPKLIISPRIYKPVVYIQCVDCLTKQIIISYSSCSLCNKIICVNCFNNNKPICTQCEENGNYYHCDTCNKYYNPTDNYNKCKLCDMCLCDKTKSFGPYCKACIKQRTCIRCRSLYLYENIGKCVNCELIICNKCAPNRLCNTLECNEKNRCKGCKVVLINKEYCLYSFASRRIIL